METVVQYYKGIFLLRMHVVAQHALTLLETLSRSIQ